MWMAGQITSYVAELVGLQDWLGRHSDTRQADTPSLYRSCSGCSDLGFEDLGYIVQSFHPNQ